MGCRGSVHAAEPQASRKGTPATPLPIPEKRVSTSDVSDTSTDDVSSSSNAASSSASSFETPDFTNEVPIGGAYDEIFQDVLDALPPDICEEVLAEETRERALTVLHAAKAPAAAVQDMDNTSLIPTSTPDLRQEAPSAGAHNEFSQDVLDSLPADVREQILTEEARERVGLLQNGFFRMREDHWRTAEPPVVKDSALRILEHQLGLELNVHSIESDSSSESEASTPRMPARNAAATPWHTPVRRESAANQAAEFRPASCLLGTSQRAADRRVSFNPAGPDVVLVESLHVDERSLSSLRRSHAISADDMELFDPFEAVVWSDPEPAAHRRMRSDSWSYPSGWPDLNALAVWEPEPHPPEAQTFLNGFGLCCVPQSRPASIDGALLVHGELEYDVCQEGDMAPPYASQLHQEEDCLILKAEKVPAVPI